MSSIWRADDQELHLPLIDLHPNVTSASRQLIKVSAKLLVREGLDCAIGGNVAGSVLKLHSVNEGCVIHVEECHGPRGFPEPYFILGFITLWEVAGLVPA